VGQDPKRSRRRSIRLSDYDYAQAGGYFVTMVVKDRACLFGEVMAGEMHLNEFGRIVQTVRGELPGHYSNIECDAFMVMTNHVHGIVILVDHGPPGKFDLGAGFKPARGVAVGPNSDRAGLKPPLRCRRLCGRSKHFRHGA